MPTVTQLHQIPDEIAALSGMDHDYADLFTITTDGVPGRAAERWAYAAFDEAAGLGGQFVWRVPLGLRLRRRPGRVAGWRIAARGADWVRIEATSWYLTPHVVFHVDDERLAVATFIRYDRPLLAGRTWTQLSKFHRAKMPGLLRHAHRIERAKGLAQTSGR